MIFFPYKKPPNRTSKFSCLACLLLGELINHRFYFLYDDSGKRTSVRTKVSHNQQEINDYLANCMKKQLHLSKDEFNDLVKCPLKYEQYLRLLKDRRVLR